MGQKVNPIGFRLGVRRNWSARWYANKNDYSKFMEEDNIIRGFLEKKLRFASVPRIVIERASTRTRVTFGLLARESSSVVRGKNLTPFENLSTVWLEKTYD